MPTLIIPQHGRSDLTLSCITSLLQHETASPQIVIIDDGSPDDSPDRLADQLPVLQRRRPDVPIELLRQPHRGLTAAWNHAARHAKWPILVFLNNDVLAHGPFLNRLLSPLEGPHPNASKACRPQPAGSPRMTGPHLRRESHLPRHILQQLPTNTFLEGWCFALRRNDLLALHGFDESMRLYWSDTDLQCRLLQQFTEHDGDASKLLQPIPELPLHHQAHQTTHAHPTHRQQWQKDRQTFQQKWTTQ